MFRIAAITAVFAGIGLALGWAYSEVVPKVYESTATVSVMDTQAASPAYQELASIIQQRAPHSTGASLKIESAGGDQSNLVFVRATSPSPQDAAKAANNAIATYQSQSAQANEAILSQKRNLLTSTISRADLRLRHVENQIALAKKQTGIIDIDSKVQDVAGYETTLLQEQDKDSARLKASQDELAEASKKLASMPKQTMGQVVEGSNPTITAYESELQQLEAKRIGLLEHWLETSQPVKDVDAQIAALKTQIAKAHLPTMSVQSKTMAPNPTALALESSIADHEAEIAGLKASLDAGRQALAAQKVAASALPAAQTQMIDLVRQKQFAEQDLTQAHNALDSLRLVGAPGLLPTISTVFPATPSNTPVWPIPATTMSIGAALGLAFGGLIGFALAPRRSFEFAVETGPSPLAPSPSGPSLNPIAAAPPLPMRKKNGLSALAAPNASPAEAYRFMVFSLQARTEDPIHTVLFTGVSSDAACAEAAAQFAIAMSQTGVKTLLADCNLRNKELTDAFGFDGKSGISDVLSKTMLPTPSGDLLQETSHPGLLFLPSGSEESDGLGGYQSVQISGLIGEFVDRAEMKVLYTPACTVVSDAPRLAKYVDTVCLVATAQDAGKGLVDKAHRILTLAGAHAVELVVVDANKAKESFLG